MDKMPIVEDYVEENTGETIPNFVYEDNDNPSLNGFGEDIRPEEKGTFEEAEKLQKQFDEELEVQPELPNKMSKEEIFDIGEPKSKPKKERKKRPPMSEEHKAKLKLAREKALAVRRKNSQDKKEMKELEKKAKQKKKEELKKYVGEDKDVEGGMKLQKQVERNNGIDVEKAVLDGIMKYEAIRKQRKLKKNEEKKVQEDKDKLKNQINNAMKPNHSIYYGDKDYFNNCF